MPAKIIDQYTDRTDLTDNQKFHLRHPDYRRNWFKKRIQQDPNYSRDRTRKWREENPEHAQALMVKSNNKGTGKSILKRKLSRFNWHERGLVNEVQKLLAKGKAPADIAVWLGVPMSKISAIAQTTTPTKSL